MRPVAFFLGIGLFASLLMLAGCGREQAGAGVERAALARLARLGEGLLAWERFRDGKWQIWGQRIDGGGLRRLVPLENGRDQFCPKISPDGRFLAYLSYERGTTPYRARGKTAHLHVLDLKTRKRTLVAREARSYAEDRAVAWFDGARFCYIDGQGRTVEHDLEAGSHDLLTDAGHSDFGWLVNATKTFATTGTPEFSPYDAAARAVRPQNRHAGCQPYFTSDGAWGFWMAGAGGPVNRMRLDSRMTSPVIRRNDARLSPGWRYVYFPMISSCRRLITFGASRGDTQHDHFRANYEIFLGQVHPESLELIGSPARATDWPECDRFPDVYRAELPLGTRFVEGETELEFAAPEASEWTWDLGEGGSATGSTVKAIFKREGHHFVEASGRLGRLQGYVHVSPPAPPKIAAVRRQGTDHLVLHFDEPVSADKAAARLETGGGRVTLAAENGGRTLRATLRGLDLAKTRQITLEGVSDLAQKPNVMPPTVVKIPGRLWPASSEGLVFAWAHNEAENRTDDGFTCRVEPRACAFWDEHHGMMLGGGSFVAPGAGERISGRCAATSQITVEMMLMPLTPESDGQMRHIFTIASGADRRNVTLGQRGGMLVLWMGASDNGPQGNRHEAVLARLESGEMHHIIVGYRPRKLEVVVDGEFYYPRFRVTGGLEGWQPGELRFGSAPDGSAAWHGKIESVAVYDRLVDDEESLEHFASSEAVLGARELADEWRVRARVLAVSKTPSLDSINPYRNALVKTRYEVLSLEGGSKAAFDHKEIVVSQWCWLDAQPMPAQRLKPGDEAALRLQLAEKNPQIKGLVNRDDVDGELEEVQFFDAGWAEPGR